MSTPRRTTRSFTAKRNSEPGYQSGAWDSGLPPQYKPTVASIRHQQQQQQYHQQRQHSPWPEPRPPRRPMLLSAPFGVYATLPQAAFIIVFILALMGKLAFEYFDLWPNSITPAPADFGWIEYIPHARISRFRGAQHGGDGGEDDIAFALGSAQHAAFATAAWRVFNATDANVNWTDPRKTQPTPSESLACRERVGAEHARLAEIWNPVRADYINSTDPSNTRLLPHLKPLLGGLSGAQLRGVDSVLRVAYRDALFLCMTLAGKRRWLTILEGNEVPNREYFFPVDVEESGTAVGEKEGADPGDNEKVAGESGNIDGDNAAVNGEDEKADGDNATFQGWGPGAKELLRERSRVR
ncbi:hypothetical protein IWX90DRAFT_477805 [Phyllosticta citrichinensis]|uniref:Uncharacterized protein n=1 Tax=Phyllosticta citrichinensis TaxID=1130410 RepID=A0ABR1XTA9_9PEZI